MKLSDMVQDNLTDEGLVSRILSLKEKNHCTKHDSKLGLQEGRLQKRQHWTRLGDKLKIFRDYLANSITPLQRCDIFPRSSV